MRTTGSDAMDDKELAASGRAVERVMEAHGWKLPFREYVEAMSKESRRYDDYITEDELDEWAEV